MKIASINENSQAAKNAQVEAVLKKVVEPCLLYTSRYFFYLFFDNNHIIKSGKSQVL